MTFYPPKISKRFQAPQNAGKAIGANAAAINATFACGSVLSLTLRIEKPTKKILEVKFKTNGCGYLIAAAETLADKIIGEHLTELHKLDKQFLQSAIETEIGQFPESRRHCFELVLETLQKAFADFRRRQIEEFTGERALICTCFGVGEETIENLVKEKRLRSIEEVTDACKAGGGCGSCQPLIQEIIDSAAHIL